MKVQHFFANRKLVLFLLFALLTTLLLTATNAEAAPEQSCGFYHRVAYGQTLSSIAYHYGVPVHALLQANPHIKNPNRIYAGSKVLIPCKSGGHPGIGGQCRQMHYVQSGQTLSEIAWHYRVYPYAIMKANGLHNPNLIYAGSSLCIPR